jgi:hypothetical protein
MPKKSKLMRVSDDFYQFMKQTSREEDESICNLTRRYTPVLKNSKYLRDFMTGRLGKR